jgi:GNAT superfamily N-acetyltransferase
MRVPLANYNAEEAAVAFNICFQDYVVKISFSGEEFERRFRSENVDPHASWVWTSARGEPEAILLIARRGKDSRVAGMGLAPARRGVGFGKEVLQTAIDGASSLASGSGPGLASGSGRLFLEVIETNARARRLYERAGFVSRGRLLGFVAPEVRDEGIERFEIDARAAARMLAADRSLDELPWQMQAETLLNSTVGARGFVIEGSVAMVAGGRLIYAPAEAKALRLLAQLGPIKTPVYYPEARYAAAFAEAGWVPMPIAQLEMLRAGVPAV